MVKVLREKEPAPGTAFGFTELYALAIGQVIGAGVITLVVPAIKMTGYSAWLAYLCAILCGFVVVLPTIFISSVVRLGGGTYSLLVGLGKPVYGGISTYIAVVQMFSMALFGSSAAAYLADCWEVLNTKGWKIAIGVALVAFFWVVNILGMDIMAKAQKLLTWYLIAALFVFGVWGLIKGDLPIFDFKDPNFLTNGWGIKFSEQGTIAGGFCGAMLLYEYSCTGYSMTINYGRDARNPRKDIPKALLVSLPTLMVLYTGVAMAGTKVMSLAEYGTSTTLTFAARKMFPPVVFVLFIVGGPICALLSTLNSSFAAKGIVLGQACDDGWLPAWFGKQNKYGARWVILTTQLAISTIPMALGLSITVITNMIQLIGGFTAILNFLSYINLPKKYPIAWKQSKYHIPDALYYVICVLSLCVSLIVIWKSYLSLTKGLALLNVVAIIVFAIMGAIRSKVGTVTVVTSIWSETHENEDYGEEFVRA